MWRWWAGSAVLALSAAGIQWGSGAYSADLASYPDEPAHVVSGLMVHDYLTRLVGLGPRILPASPREFAEAYYLHYPKVAIGHWPPLFYVVQAAWMLVFGRTKTALLLLMLTVVALTAVLVRDVARRVSGSEWAALPAAAVFLLLPVTQQSLYAVMPDAVLALMACCAIAIGCNPRWSLAWLWAVAIAAVLVHFRGAPLLLLFFIAMALKKRTGTPGERGQWILMLVALLLAVLPFFFLHQTGKIHVHNVAVATARFPVHMLRTLGLVPFAMTVLGAFTVPYRKRPEWFGITGVLAGTWLFFCVAIVPWDNRYLMIAVPACVLLMTRAWQWLAIRLAPITGLPGARILAAAAIGTLLACFHYPLIVRKPNANYEAAVSQVLEGPDAERTVYLVAGNSVCEGAFIAGIDLRDVPGRHIVLRSSKVLSQSSWSGTSYSLRFGSPEEVAAFLAGSHISVIVIDRTARSDVEMLGIALRQTPAWTELPSSSPTRIYRRTSPLPPSPVSIHLDMSHSLKRSLDWTQ
jgi:hypothetical protein